MIKAGQRVYFSIPVQSSTGAATNADAQPTVLVYKNNAVQAGITPSVESHPPATTGVYNGYYDVPSGGSAPTAGDCFEARAQVVRGGITSPYVAVRRDFVDSVRFADIVDSDGALKANLWKILSTTLTETSGGYIAAAFKKLLDVAVPIFTVESVVQSGNSYPIVSHVSYGNAALKALMDTAIAALTHGTYGLSALQVAIAALQTAVLNISNNTSTKLVVNPILEIPDAGTVTYELDLLVMDSDGKMEAPDSLPTVTAKNATGTDRSANLSVVSLVSTGHYTLTYTLSSGDPAEQLVFTAEIVEGGQTRKSIASSTVANADITGTAAKVNSIFNDYARREGDYSTFDPVLDRVVLDENQPDYTPAKVTDIPTDYQQRNVEVTLPGTMADDYARRANDYATTDELNDAVSGMLLVIGSPMQATSYLAPNNSGITTLLQRATALLSTKVELDAQFQEVMQAIGDIETGGGGGDPLLNEVPGDYEVGTAGHAIGRLRVPLPESSPVDVVENPEIEGIVTITCLSSDFTTMKDGTRFRFKLKSKSRFVDGWYQTDKSQEGVTTDGSVGIQLWDSEYLESHGLDTGLYQLEVNGRYERDVWVKAEGGLLREQPSWKPE